MQPVLLLLLGAHLAYAGTHSLRYFYTAVSGIRDIPEFTAVGLVDEGQFMYFDSKAKEAVPKTEWIRENVGADYWDSQSQGLIGSHQIYKNNIQTLKELFNQSAVSPQVSLQQKSSSSRVLCHATGFYPKEVTISWQKNGQDHDEDVDLGELLPNEDRTFQKTSTLRVTPDELKKNEYSCVVEHQGKTIREILTDDSLPIGVIVGAIAAVVLLLAVIGVIGVIVFKVLQKKKKTDFKPVNASDDGSNNS